MVEEETKEVAELEVVEKRVKQVEEEKTNAVVEVEGRKMANEFAEVGGPSMKASTAPHQRKPVRNKGGNWERLIQRDVGAGVGKGEKMQLL